MPDFAAKVVKSEFIFLGAHWLESPPPDDAPLAHDVESLVYELGRLLDALHFVQREIIEGTGLLSDRPAPFRCLMVWLNRAQRAVAPFRDELRKVHSAREGIPEVGGKAVRSYVEAAIDAAAKRISWTVQFVPFSSDESLNERAAADAEAIVERLDRIREHWRFPAVDVEDLWRRVLWETEQLIPKRARRTDGPTEAEIEAVRNIIAGMTTRNPTRDAVAEACRCAGVKLRNEKVGAIMKLIKQP